MTGRPLVSIVIVDYKKNNPLLIECLEAIQKQSFTNFEVILVTDYPVSLKYPKLIKKSFGHYVGPAEKRDWGGEHAKGDILAFIDDDAFPDTNWLKNMVKDFKDPFVAAVGGPGVSPPGVNWSEEASGWMSASPLGSGPYTYRFLPGKKIYVDDFPSMNLAVRKKDFLEIGGYDSHYWPGEDTKLCLDIILKLKKKIIYDPEVLVFHHRRPLWLPHLRQNGNFGLHRGFFARILPQTSFKPVYLAPSFMLLGIVYLGAYTLFPLCINGGVCQYSDWMRMTNSIYSIGWILFIGYLLAVAANSVWIYSKSKSLFQAVLSFFVIFITHLWYGLRFIQGFFLTKNLTR